MKKALVFLIALLLIVPVADACVGKVLNIGVIKSAEGQLFGEMISTLITERTGTTVKVQTYGSEQELYNAVKVKEVDILIENTAQALKVLNRPAEADAWRAYDIVKTAYEKEKGLIWLKPFGFVNGNGASAPSHTATLLRNDVLYNFPALPRVINKLGNTVNDDTYSRIMKSVESGGEPKGVARDFLKSKKLI